MPAVTAVLVCHDGETYLPRTLDAIAAQTRPPDVLIAIDAGAEHSNTDRLLAVTPHVLRLGRHTSFCDAVAAALTCLDASRAHPRPEPRPESSPDASPDASPAAPVEAPAEVPGEAAEVNRDDEKPAPADLTTTADGPGQAPQWLWFLHDDCAPDPAALERLLNAVEKAPSVAVAGCKQVEWDDQHALRDVGFTVSRFGLRVSGVDRHEVDQGQHDERCDVMAVNLAGMLVRRDVWEALGGPDPALKHAREDLDLCRRAHLAGHRVMVVPGAVMNHAAARSAAAATAPERERSSAAWARADRMDNLRLRLTWARWYLLPLLLCWVVLAAPVRAAWRLLIKQPRSAVAELVAPVAVLLTPMALLRARRREAAHRVVPRRVLRSLLAGPHEIWRQRRDDLTAFLSWGPAEDEDSQAPAPRPDTSPEFNAVLAEPGPVAEEAEDLPSSGAWLRLLVARFATPAFVITALAVISLLALHRIATFQGSAMSGVLLPAANSAGELWRSAMSTWRAVGLGAPAASDPFAAVLSIASWPAAGSPRLLVTLLLLASLPLAGLTAWVAAGAVTGSRALRAWTAIVWAGAGSLLASLTAGRLATVVVHILLPLVVLGIARVVGWAPMRTSRTAYTVASATGLGLAVVLAGAPSLAVPAALACLLVLEFAPRGRLLLLWTMLIPLVLLLPWWRAVMNSPVLLLADPGVPASGGGLSSGTPWWTLAAIPAAPADLLGGPSGAPQRLLTDLVPQWQTWFDEVLIGCAVAAIVPVALLAIKAVLGPRSRPALAAWLLALTGLAVGLLAPRVQVASTPDGGTFGWAGPGTSLFLFGLLAAAVIGLRGAGGRVRRRPSHRGLRLTGAAAVAAVCTLAPLLTVCTWAWTAYVDGTAGADGDGLLAGDPDVLPDVAAVEARGALAQRTLVLQVRPDGVDWTLARDAGARIGDSSAALAHAELSGVRVTADADVVVPVIADLLSDTEKDLRPAWQQLAVASVLLLPPLDPSAALAIDASPGLVRSGTPSGGLLWRVEPSAADAVDGDREALAARRGARVRVVSAEGKVLAAIPSAVPEEGTDVRAGIGDGPPGRLLVLAERADPGWRAWVDGRALVPRAEAGWAQAFELPTDGGRLVVTFRSPQQGVSDAGRALVAVVAGLLALPLPRLRRPRVSPPRHSQPVGRQVMTRPDHATGVAGAPLGTPEAMDAWLAAAPPATPPDGEQAAPDAPGTPDEPRTQVEPGEPDEPAASAVLDMSEQSHAGSGARPSTAGDPS